MKIRKFLLLFVELLVISLPQKIMAQAQIMYGPQPLYGIRPIPSAPQNIFLGLFQLAITPLVLLFLIFVGILMLIKRKIKSDLPKPKKTG